MSSSRAKTLSDEYRFVSGLILGELSRPCQTRTTAGSGQVTIDELNVRDFHAFEAAIPSLSGAFDRLDEAARNQVSGDEQDFGKHTSGSPFARIETGLGNFLKWFSSLIPSRSQSQVVPEADHGRDADDVEDIIQRVVETGTLDSNVRQILALCIQKPREAMDALTEVNKMVEIEMLQPGGPRPAEMSERDTPNRIVTEVADSRTPPEVLFDHLALRSDCHEEHHAWLQLSGRDMSQDQAEFHMFLSCCNIGEKYHKTRCTLSRYAAPLRQQAPSPLNVCTQAKEAHEERIPLLLSFDSSGIWPTTKDLHLLPKQTPKHLSLELLLQVGQLKSTNPDAMLQKYRLALQLASSLYHLYPGPWVQHNLTAKDIFVFQDGTADPFEKLGEPHVHCLLQKGWKLTNPVAEAFKRYGSDRYCVFFLSFAQLLVDIAKGNPGPYSSSDSPISWYQALADEAEETFSDEIVKHYKKAIEGCLLYLRHYKSEDTRTTNTVLRAQEVIYQKILCPLQENLSHWEKEVAQQGKSTDNKNEEDNSMVVGQARGRSTVEFTLFSDENGQYPDWPDTIPALALDERDFTVCMAKYIAKFIQPPPPDKFEYVKVAIIDTGFYADENDYFLQGAEDRVKERKSFVGPNDDWMDREGHGTQVARLLLKHAPAADIYIAKISNSHTLDETKVDRLVKALEWAGTQADIINLSFGLGQNCLSGLGNAIHDLVSKNKLIFAAASNCGGNGSRPWPANQPGVFCIHTTNERGVTNQNMNPFAVEKQDNFATLGENIESFWDGGKRCISGTSFATPIAAAIAANVLHFARKHLEKEDADELMKYKVMRSLMRKLSKQSNSRHDYINPWNTGLWTQDASDEKAARMLKRIVTYLE